MDFLDKLRTSGIHEEVFFSENPTDQAIDFFIYWYTNGKKSFDRLSPSNKNKMHNIAKNLSHSEVGEMFAANILKQKYELLFANIKNKTGKHDNPTGVDLFMKRESVYYFVEVKNVEVNSIKNINNNISRVISDIEKRMNDIENSLSATDVDDFFDKDGFLIKEMLAKVSGIGIVIKADFQHTSNAKPKFGVGVIDVKEGTQMKYKTKIQEFGER